MDGDKAAERWRKRISRGRRNALETRVRRSEEKGRQAELWTVGWNGLVQEAHSSVPESILS